MQIPLLLTYSLPFVITLDDTINELNTIAERCGSIYKIDPATKCLQCEHEYRLLTTEP